MKIFRCKSRSPHKKFIYFLDECSSNTKNKRKKNPFDGFINYRIQSWHMTSQIHSCFRLHSLTFVLCRHCDWNNTFCLYILFLVRFFIPRARCMISKWLRCYLSFWSRNFKTFMLQLPFFSFIDITHWFGHWFHRWHA